MSVLMFGMCLHASAASTNSNRGVKQEQTSVIQAEAKPTSGAVQTGEQNKVMNKGEESQIRTQDQNEIQTGSEKDSVNGNEKTTGSQAGQKKSQVASAVQEMLKIADRNGGIGQQVRIIAQNQNQNQENLGKNVENIQSRGGFMKLLVGPDYGQIKDSQKILEQNKEQIRQLNQIKTKLSNEEDEQQLQQQIMILEQANQEIASELEKTQTGFSLFGWLNKIVS